MAIDTKPNLTSNKFEQCSLDVLNLSGCTQVFGTFDVQPGGTIDSCSGYQVSGATIFDTGVNLNTLQIGQLAVAGGVCAIAIGALACVTQACGIAIGAKSQSNSTTSIAIGHNTKVSGNTSVHLGTFGCSLGNGNTILGYNATANGSGVAIGSNSNASAVNTVVVGYTSCALCQHGIAIGGSGTKSCHQATIAIGSSSEASGVDSISVGYFSLSRNFYSIALGYNSCATGHTSIAIGCNTKAVGFASIVLGSCGSCANNTCTLVIGANSCSTGVDSITIGANAKSIGNCGMAFGKNAAVTGTSGIAIGNSAAVAVLNAVAIGCSAYAKSSSGVVIGNTACAIQNQAVAIGFGTTACGYQSIAIGQQASTTGNTSIAIGLSSKSSENESIAIGTQARTYCACGIAIGYNNISCATNGSILGGYSNILGATNNSATLVGASNVKLTGATSYSGYVVVPNFAILCTPSGSGNYLCWNATTKKVELSTAGEGSLTAISGGSGMNFSPITSSGSVILGTPSSISSGSTNVASGTTHNHCFNGQTFVTGTQGILVDGSNRFYLDESYITNATLPSLYTFSGITGNSSLGALPSGQTLGMVYITNTGSSIGYFSLGTTPTGDDITPYQTIQVDPGEDVSVTVNMRLSLTANTTIYISSVDWTNVGINLQWANITYQNASTTINPGDLPVASETTLGAVIIGSGLSVDGSGNLCAIGGGTITGGTNGLGVSGANICLGGSLSQNTILSGGTDTGYSLSMPNLGALYVTGNTGVTLCSVFGGGSSCITIDSATNVDMRSCTSCLHLGGYKLGSTLLHSSEKVYLSGGTYGMILDSAAGTCLTGLPAKSSETCVVYISSTGKLATGVGGGGAGTITGGTNGLSVNGPDITLGGTLTATTTNICTTSKMFSIRDEDQYDGIYLCNEDVYVGRNCAASSVNSYLAIYKSTGNLELGSGDGVNGTCLRMWSNGCADFTFNCKVIISDNTLQQGLQYQTDYSGSFIPESLITKRFVDACIASGNTAGGFLGTVTDTTAEPTNLRNNQWVKPEPNSSCCFNYTFTNFCDIGASPISVNLSLEDVYLRYQQSGDYWIKESYNKPLSSGYTWMGNANCEVCEIRVIDEWVGSESALLYAGQKYSLPTQTISVVDVATCQISPNYVICRNIPLNVTGCTTVFTIPTGCGAIINRARLIFQQAGTTSFCVSIGNNYCITPSLAYNNLVSCVQIDDPTAQCTYSLSILEQGVLASGGSNVIFKVGSAASITLCAHLLVEGLLY